MRRVSPWATGGHDSARGPKVGGARSTSGPPGRFVHAVAIRIDKPSFEFTPVSSRVASRSGAPIHALLVVIFATFVLGPYPASLDAGGAHVQIWRVAFVVGVLVIVPATLRSTSGVPAVPLDFLTLAAGWIGWGLLSFAWTPSLPSGIIEFIGLVTGATLTLVVATIGSMSESHRRLLTQCWAVAVGFVASASLVEYFSGAHLPSPYASQLSQLGIQTRFLTGTFGNPNDVAAFLLVGLPFAIASIPTWPTRTLRRIATCVPGLAVLTIVLSNSRLCALGLVVGVITYILLGKNGRRTYRVRLAYLLLLVLPLALVASEPRLLAKFGNLSVEWSRGGSLQDRFLLLRHGWNITYATGLRGLGIGAFEPSVQSLPKQLTSSGDINPHNFAMELLSQYGIVVAFAFWLWIGRSAKRALRHRRETIALGKGPFATLLATMTIIGFTLFIPASSDPSSFIEQGTGWLFLGTLMAVVPNKPSASP